MYSWGERASLAALKRPLSLRSRYKQFLGTDLRYLHFKAMVSLTSLRDRERVMFGAWQLGWGALCKSCREGVAKTGSWELKRLSGASGGILRRWSYILKRGIDSGCGL